MKPKWETKKKEVKVIQGNKEHLLYTFTCLSLVFFTSMFLSGVVSWLDLLGLYNDDDRTLLIAPPVLALLLTAPLAKLIGRLIQKEKETATDKEKQSDK